MIRRAPLVAAVVLLAGCGGGGAGRPGAAAAAPATAAGEILLEDFEDDRRWTIDAAGDWAALRGDSAHATAGALALAADIADNGRDKLILRKEVDDDFEPVTAVALDAWLVAGQADVVFAARTRAGGLYEFARRPLAPGLNRDLRWRLERGDLVSGDWSGWLRDRAQVERLLLEIHPLKGPATVAVDRLRVVSPKPVRRRAEPRLVALGDAPTRVGLHRVFGFDCALERPATPTLAGDQAFARMDDVRLRLRAPDGERIETRCFATGIEVADGRAIYSYRARFAPWRAGEWRWQLVFGDDVAAAATDPAAFVCDDADAGPGVIRVDDRDPRWLRDDDGRFFYPIGMNVAWAGDYGPYFGALADAGANATRVWICPWNHPLDHDGKFEPPDFANAAAIDAMLSQAETRGLRVVLVLQFHGALAWDWARNPWNAAHGGPCKDAREFWTREDARARFRRYLDYCVARWAASPALLAWELVNEADLCPSFRREDIVDWHRAMGAHLKAIDPYRHLVTASVAATDSLPGLWTLAEIDVVQPHRYGADAGAALAALADLGRAAKPVWVGEIGRGWQARDDQVDERGRLLRQALWLGWLSDAAGAPLPWWWDTHVEPNRLCRLLAPLARFTAGEDRRGRRFARLSRGEGRYAVDALLAPDLAYAYLHDPRAVAEPRAPALAPLLEARDAIELAPVLPGRWSIEWWDVADPDAAPAEETVEVAVDGVLRLKPGARLGDVALKARRAPQEPSLRVDE